MAVDAYLVASWDPDRLSAIDTARLMKLRQQFGGNPTWRVARHGPGLFVFTGAAGDLTVRDLPGRLGFVIGDVFDRSGEGTLDFARLDAQGPVAVCCWLAGQGWGRYVAVLPDPSRDQVSVFRDPMGGLEAVVWRSGGVTVVASGLPEPLLALLGPDLALDWDRIVGFVVNTMTLVGPLALRGLTAVGPGELLVQGLRPTPPQALWRAADIVRQAAAPAQPAAALVDTLDTCVRAWARRYGPALAEVSGGLDSAMVAASLVAARASIVGWINHYTTDPLGDERVFARAVARRLGLTLTESPTPPLILRPEDFAAVAQGVRPSLNGAEPPYDSAMSEACRQQGAKALFTGQGGDALFFQMVTPWVAADRLRRCGPTAETGAYGLKVAHWTRQSIWRVAGRAIIGAVGLARPARRPTPAFLAKDHAQRARRRLAHPWLEGIGGLPPAKQLQIEHLAYGQLFMGDCRRGRAAVLLHPLLSQPLVELCLRLPADQLVDAPEPSLLGRGLARRAFASRLPDDVLRRRSKGDMTAFHGQAIARSLTALRPFLLEGRLVAQGIVDRAALDRCLGLEALCRDGGYADILDLLAIEAWVQAWEGRLAALASPAAR